MVRTKRIASGAWRTVESFWNASGTAFFRGPAGARIRVRYGIGFLGFDTQTQILNGLEFKKLTIGPGSVACARIQVRVPQSADVSYDVYGGGFPVGSPAVPF